jgi:hypothetical protein
MPIETYRYGSPRVVAVLRLFDTMSDEELARQIARPSGVLDPATMSDRDLDTLIDELRQRSTKRVTSPSSSERILSRSRRPN